jgi:hypothetical protein
MFRAFGNAFHHLENHTELIPRFQFFSIESDLSNSNRGFVSRIEPSDSDKNFKKSKKKNSDILTFIEMSAK